MSPTTTPPDDSVSLKDHLRNLPQTLLPQRLLTRLSYRLTRLRTPWLKDRLIRWFIQHYQVRLAEAQEPDPRAYPDFNAFFTRALQPGARPIAPGDRVVCTPYEKFAQMIERHWDGIAAYCQPENKVSLGFVEGLNNKIRVLQRRSYGLRDEDYLRLKILTCMLPQL